MENKHLSEQIPDYLDDRLGTAEQRSMEEHLKACAQCRQELQEMECLFRAMEKENVPVPSKSLADQFEAVLALEKGKMGVVPGPMAPQRTKWPYQLLKVAAGLALLIGAFQLGSLSREQKTEREIAVLQEQGLEMKQTAMLSLLENRSASKRIQGVRYIEAFDSPDPQIIEALGKRLLYDQNDNVRLTAYEALSGFSTFPSVKDLMITALEMERNPSLQVAIIQLLVQIQEKKAIAPMKSLLDREDTQPFIKEQIEAVLPSLT